MGGVLPPDAEPPPFPLALEYVWRWFLQLHNARVSGFGPSAISWLELDAWSRFTGNRPTPWEVQVLMAVDAEYLNSQAEKPA